MEHRTGSPGPRLLGLPLLLALPLAIIGCGGSGGSSTGNAPPPPTMNCDGTPVAADGAADPFAALQWHLRNSAPGGFDLNLGNAHSITRGGGLLMSVVDDGLDIGHEDLQHNVRPGRSINFYAGMPGFSASDTDPTPSTAPVQPPARPPGHGTAVGGIMAARDLNGLGVSGVAPRACLIGANLIGIGGHTPVMEATAIATNDSAQLAVSNNSWGAPDGIGLNFPSSMTFRDAVQAGITTGRGGLGTVFLWAAGNGARVFPGNNLDTDNSNYDGQANFSAVLAIGGVMDNGVRVAYSEKGANLWVVGFSQGTTYENDNRGITSIDVTGAGGYNARPAAAAATDVSLMGNDYLNGNYTQGFNGTSAATPTVAGVVALVLAANPRLTQRDLRLLLAETARRNDTGNADWATNRGVRLDGGMGYHVNHEYGFGLVDAQAAVTRAGTWTNVGPQVTAQDTGVVTVNQMFADNDPAGASNAIPVSGSAVQRIEYMEIYLTTASADVGDLDVRLEGSAGTHDQLAEPHNCFAPNTPAPVAVCGQTYEGWRFGSARHLGESANQTWTLRVSDRRAGQTAGGTLVSWRLVFQGRAQ